MTNVDITIEDSFTAPEIEAAVAMVLGLRLVDVVVVDPFDHGVDGKTRVELIAYPAGFRTNISIWGATGDEATFARRMAEVTGSRVLCDAENFGGEFPFEALVEPDGRASIVSTYEGEDGTAEEHCTFVAEVIRLADTRPQVIDLRPHLALHA